METLGSIECFVFWPEKRMETLGSIECFVRSAEAGSFSEAAGEAAKAKELDPAIKFTQPEKFLAFEKLLEREQKSVQRPESSSSSVVPSAATAAPLRGEASGVPSWAWLAALGVVAYVLWRGFARSRASASPGGPFGVPGTATTNGYGAGAPYVNAPPASPTGRLLKTGLAVAGGVAAGMMVDEMVSSFEPSVLS